MNAHRFILASALGVFLGLGSAQAEPMVYDLTAGPGETREMNPDFTETLNIYIDLGAIVSSGGSVLCDDGDGDELCAADVLLTLDGAAEIDSFIAPMDVVYEVHLESDPDTPSWIRLNVLQSTAANPPPAPGPQNLGTLTLSVASTAEENPVQLVATGQIVDASGSLVDIPSRGIAFAPEPTGIVLLLSGALALAALHGLRTRGAGVTVTGESQIPK
jgi:hypothetical protein